MEVKAHLSARDMAYCALMAVLIAVCSCISLPLGAVPFTLQTFGVCCALGLLGGMRGTIAIAVYIMLGALGLPVFSGFSSGMGALMGATGGYIVGFLATGLIYWRITGRRRRRWPIKALAMLSGLIACYTFGTAWFMAVYVRTTGPVGVGAALSWCVMPFIIPELCKLAAALLLSERLRRHVRI